MTISGTLIESLSKNSSKIFFELLSQFHIVITDYNSHRNLPTDRIVEIIILYYGQKITLHKDQKSVKIVVSSKNG